eukprot:SAG31_NODE_424_length_15826_cov_4.954664_8_plen_352_part_00
MQGEHGSPSGARRDTSSTSALKCNAPARLAVSLTCSFDASYPLRTQETHAKEIARQREHEMLLAKISRTDRVRLFLPQRDARIVLARMLLNIALLDFNRHLSPARPQALDNCCQPCQAALDEIANARYYFMNTAVAELETDAPEVVAHMLEQCKEMKTYRVGDGLQLIRLSATEGKYANHAPSWDRKTLPLSLAHGLNVSAFSSASAAAISMTDFYIFHSQPFCGEVATGILQFVEANPASNLANRFRLHIRHSLLPPIMRVVELLEAHGCVTELPPLDWLKLRFPSEAWSAQPPRTYRRFWYARARAWLALIAEWSDGDYGNATPGGEFLPYGGIVGITEWAMARNQDRQ